MTEQPSTRQKLTSRQFLITMTGMGLMTWATLAGANVVPLSTVVVVAITGQAGVNAMERKK